MRRRIAERIAAWYRGRFIPPPANDPGSGIYFVSPGHYEQPWLARVLAAGGRFYLRHWQFLWTMGVAVAGVVVAALTLL